MVLTVVDPDTSEASSRISDSTSPKRVSTSLQPRNNRSPAGVGVTWRALDLTGPIAHTDDQLSQRVGLARAFATQAPILLMDEPFSALDPLIRARLQDELLDLQAKLKRTIIFVSHDLDEAFKLGDRIALMEGGRIVQIGTAREIIAGPVSDYVADFVAHMNPLAVLTARDVMEQGQGNPAAAVDCELPVKAVMDLLAKGVTELAVTEDGQKIGQIRAASLMARLINPRQA